MGQDSISYAVSESSIFNSRRGRTVSVRLVTEYDKNRLFELLRSLSSQTYLMRFLTPLPGVPPEMAQSEVIRLTRPDHERQITLVATVAEDEREKVIGVGELVCNDLADPPEIALLVGDDYQREGIGSALLKAISLLATQRQIATLQALVLNENKPTQSLLHKLGLKYTSQTRYGEQLLSIQLD